MEDARQLKAEILKLTRRYSELVHRANRPGYEGSGNAGCSSPELQFKDSEAFPLNLNAEAKPSAILNTAPAAIPYAGRVFTEDEVEAAVSSTLDFWLTLGPEGEAFEQELASFLGVKKCLAVNSGSSANLVAFSCLTSHKLPEERRIRPGDEVITCAAGFPTTVTPILQNGAIPVFLDNNPITGNADLSRLDEAYVPGKTKAVMMAHALGNPFDLARVLEFCQRHNLWLIEDNCDALGSTYSLPVEKARELGLEHLLRLAEKNAEPLNGEKVERTDSPNPSTVEPFSLSAKIPFIRNGSLTAYTGSFGDLSTQSFYPPHHLTMGEGGSVNIVKDMKLKVLAESFRDWGRDCWCASGKDNTCNKRFGWQLGELPLGYDHKYIYSHLGYNLKPLDPQAAIGRQQLKKLPAFVEARKRNWQALRAGLAGLEDCFEFALPTHATAWVGVEQGNGSAVEGEKNLSIPLLSPNPSTSQPFNFSTTSLGCSNPSWFGFMMLVRPTAPFTRTEFVKYLDEKKIGNRMLFGGNLVRQPAFVQLRKDNPGAFRIVGELPLNGGIVESLKRSPLPSTLQQINPSIADPAAGKSCPKAGIGTSDLLPGADRIMNESVFIGVYPGLTSEMIGYMIETIRAFAADRLRIKSQV